MPSTIQLLTTSDEAQLRRLEPRLYHLVFTARPRWRTARALEQIVDEDAAPESYALVVEALASMRDPFAAAALFLPRACHVALVSRSPLSAGLARAATALSRLAGGPKIVRYGSLEAGFAAAQRALARSAS